MLRTGRKLAALKQCGPYVLRTPYCLTKSHG